MLSDTVVASENLEAWAPTMPYYLADLQNDTVTSECNCITRLANCNCNLFDNCEDALATNETPHRRRRRQAADRMCVNGRPMEADKEPFHLQKFDTIQERSLFAVQAHPYHQHTH